MRRPHFVSSNFIILENQFTFCFWFVLAEFKKVLKGALFSPNLTVTPPQLEISQPFENHRSLPTNELADLINLESAQNSPAYRAKSTKDNSPSQSVKLFQSQKVDLGMYLKCLADSPGLED